MYDSASLSVFSGCPTEPSGFYCQHKLALTFVSGHFLLFSLKLTFLTNTFSWLPFREVLDFPQGEAAARPYHVYTDFGGKWEEKGLQIWRDAKDTFKAVKEMASF